MREPGIQLPDNEKAPDMPGLCFSGENETQYLSTSGAPNL